MNKSMRRQAGNMLITTLLALVIASVFALVKVRENIIDQKRATGIGEAKLLSTLANGVNTLIANEWLDFQNGSTVTYNSVSVVPSTVSGVTTWSPTIAQLQSMGLPTTGWTATTSSITSGALTVTIMRTPSGCSGTACSVVGYVYAAAPYLNNNASGTTDSVVVGAMLTQLGTDGGVSLPTSTSTITGYASSWTYANPVTSSPAGVVAVQVGVSSAAYAQFVRIGDTRDPSLQGALTVAGATTLKSTLGVTGTTTLASTLNVTGATAMASTLGVAGAATLSSTLGVSGASTLTGAVSGGSTATFASRVKGQMLASSTTAAAGASCSGYSEGDTVLDATTTGTVLTCRSSVWVRPGLPVGGNRRSMHDWHARRDDSQRGTDLSQCRIRLLERSRSKPGPHGPLPWHWGGHGRCTDLWNRRERSDRRHSARNWFRYRRHSRAQSVLVRDLVRKLDVDDFASSHRLRGRNVHLGLLRHGIRLQLGGDYFLQLRRRRLKRALAVVNLSAFFHFWNPK
jgi:hypothetical protein